MQTSGGVGNDHVVAAGVGALDGVEDDRRRVRAHAGLDQRHVGALGPELQLLTGGGAEGIARCQHDAAALLLYRPASLAIVVVLPTPLTPMTRMTAGLPSRSIG